MAEESAGHEQQEIDRRGHAERQFQHARIIGQRGGLIHYPIGGSRVRLTTCQMGASYANVWLAPLQELARRPRMQESGRESGRPAVSRYGVSPQALRADDARPLPAVPPIASAQGMR